MSACILQTQGGYEPGYAAKSCLYAQHFRSRVVHYVWYSYNWLQALPKDILKPGMAQVLRVKPGSNSTWEQLCPGHMGIGLYFMTALAILHGFVLMCLPPFLFCSSRPEDVWPDWMSHIQLSSGVWSYGVKGNIQGCPSQGVQLGTLDHGPSLCCCWHPMCPFKWGTLLTVSCSQCPCSQCLCSRWSTRSIRDSHAGREGMSSFCYYGSEKFLQYLAAPWHLASISAYCLLPLSSSRSTGYMASGQPLTSVTLV